jgi:hypothetical protein
MRPPLMPSGARFWGFDFMAHEKIILDLCSGTGSWSKPYKDAGYDVRLITLPENDVLTYVPPENVYGILAAPPCTEFSQLNREKFKNKQLFLGYDKYKNSPNTSILNACLSIIEKCNPVIYAIENPCGLMRTYMGKPAFTFQPYQFGDGWTKKTDIWGKFNIPKQKYSWATCPKLALYIRPNRKKPSLAFCHRLAISAIPQLKDFEASTDSALRAITPPGFAKAFFEANQ